jgi:predicted protein tyrosine phosphatase
MLIPFHLTVCGLHELDGANDPHATHVLSILDPGMPQPATFASWPAHARLELRFDDVIEDAPGFQPPTADHVAQVLAFGRSLQAERDGHLLVHCYAGISRSSASMYLMLAQARPDRAPAELLAEVARIRPQIWPNLRMVELGDAALGRHGAVVEPLAAHYARRLKTEPSLNDVMRRLGRAREIALARTVR